MYGLPPDFDPGFFVGAELVQVCIGASDLILNFEPDVSLTITSSVAYAPAVGAARNFENLADAGRAISVLLGESITSAEAAGGGTLRLGFRSGAAIDIFDDSDQFESYLVKHGQQVIVV